MILVTELTRWGRSMLDLFHTLQDLQAWDVSLVAQTGLQFDLRSAQGRCRGLVQCWGCSVTFLVV